MIGPTIGIFITCLTILIKGECPGKFIHLEDGCYHFSDDPMTRQEAVNYCGALTANSNLATFDSCSDFVHVSHYLETSGSSLGSYDPNFWTGVYVTGEFSGWNETSQTIPYGVPYWNPYVSTRNGGCGKMPSQGGYLIPADCYEPGYPMCEIYPKTKKDEEIMNKNKQTRQKVDCPTPFVGVGERCFYVNKNSSTWDDARKNCAALLSGQYADLAVLGDCSSFTSIAHYLGSNGADKNGIWVGAKTPVSGSFRWIDGDYLDPGVPYWSPGEPNDNDGEESCVMLWGANLYYAADEDCSAVHTALCEIGL